MAEHFALGLDIGGTNIKAGIVAESGELIDHVIATTPARRDPPDVVAAAAQAARTLLARNEVHPEGIGIAAAGMVDLAGEHVKCAPNFPSWDNVPLRADIEKAIGLPTVLGNDVDAFGLAEHCWGAAVGMQHFIAAAIGTGLGGAIFIHGKPYRGAIGAAAELGFTVISPDGPAVLKRPGVIEGYIGRHGFDEIVLKHFPTGEIPNPRKVTELAAQGDTRARKVHSEVAGYLAEAAASWLHILNPEAIVLGGGTLAGADFFFEEFERKLRARALPLHFSCLKILQSKLGYLAGVQGAAALWFRREKENAKTEI
ncbi:ROK family protein [candidate division KSB1 bacterium]|nr:MAG: ROK family protein [candidate division KSB1 bacterium]